MKKQLMVMIYVRRKMTNLLEIKNKLLEAHQVKKELIKMMDDRIKYYETTIQYEQAELNRKENAQK